MNNSNSATQKEPRENVLKEDLKWEPVKILTEYEEQHRLLNLGKYTKLSF